MEKAFELLQAASNEAIAEYMDNMPRPSEEGVEAFLAQTTLEPDIKRALTRVLRAYEDVVIAAAKDGLNAGDPAEKGGGQ